MVDASLERLRDVHARMKTELGRVIVGQDEVVEQLLMGILTRGHCLLVGVPGLAKTLMISSLARTMELDFNRIQFTPDLMPSDITGTELLHIDPETSARTFRFEQGPLFTNVLLADEINRTPPKTQAALLEAMVERQVSSGGKTHKLPEPFFVLATQNPIEQEGTYPLPEAQLDRFLLRVDIPYPTREAERQVLLATTGAASTDAVKVLDANEILKLQALVRALPVGEKVLDAILDLLRLARPEETDVEAVRTGVSWGPGPRAGQALMLACRARALLQGRLAPSTEDVAALAEPVLKHRMALSFAARADGHTLEGLIKSLAERAA